MPIERPKFVLADSFSYLNKGDAGIILGMITDIEEKFGKPEFTIVTETPDIDQQRYPKNTKTIQSPFRRVYQAENKLKKLYLFGFTFLLLFWALVYRVSSGRVPCSKKSQIIHEYASSEAVLIAGGDKYYDNEDGLKRAIEGLPKLFEGALAIILRKKLMIYAHSAGPFENRYRRVLLRWMFNNTDIITAREPISKEYFELLEVDADLTADPAFLAPDGNQEAAGLELEEHSIDLSKPIAGITAREWHFPQSSGNMVQYKKAMTETVKYLRKNDFQVVFFPQVIGPYADDRILSRDIACNIEGAIVLNGDYNVPLLREMIGMCDIFVGTRMHSNIFSLSKEVPTVAIAYRHKTNGIMQMLDLEEHVVDISDTEAELLDSVENLLQHRIRIADSLSSSIPEIEQQSSENSEYLSRVVEQYRLL